MIEVKDNSQPSICSKCGGQCCKRSPGIIHPEERKLNKRIIRQMLNGDYIFDYWEGSRPLYYLRPKQVNETEGRWFNGAWGGQCKLLTPTGCSLKFADRPHQCRTLVPQPDTFCKSTGITKIEYAKLWMKKYGRVIRELRNEYDKRF